MSEVDPNRPYRVQPRWGEAVYIFKQGSALQLHTPEAAAVELNALNGRASLAEAERDRLRDAEIARTAGILCSGCVHVIERGDQEARVYCGDCSAEMPDNIEHAARQGEAEMDCRAARRHLEALIATCKGREDSAKLIARGAAIASAEAWLEEARREEGATQ